MRPCDKHLLIGLVLALCGLSCSEATTTDGPAPPPPPAQAPKPAVVYDYSHSISPQRAAKLSRKPVIALVRFGEDRPVEDVPYGQEPDKKSGAPEGATNVQVDVQFGDRNAPGPEKQPPAMNIRAREILKRELMDTESFVLVERERILDILRELKFGQTKFVNPQTSPEIGDVMAVQYLLEGSMGLNEDLSFKGTIEPPPNYRDGEPNLPDRVYGRGKSAQAERQRDLDHARRKQAKMRVMEARNRYGVYLSLYDVRTSEIVIEAFGLGSTGALAIRDAVEDLLDKCMDLPNPARIAAVDGTRVYVDLGEEDHVAVGQRFRYVNPGPEVRNQAGQVIGSREEEGGELEIRQVQRLMSVGEVTRKVAEPAVGARIESLN
jgi:hypothetical protein